MSPEDELSTSPTAGPLEDELAEFLRDTAGGAVSAATRELLCHRFGYPRDGGAEPLDGLRPLAPSAAAAAADDPPPNVRVNDPGEDTAAGNRTTQNRPTLVVDGLNVLVAFNDSTLDSTFAGIARSADGGMTFVDAGALAGSQRGSPVLAADGAGNVYYATLVINPGSTATTIAVARSTDGGMTFGAPVVALSIALQADHYELDEWLTVDQASGNLYLVWTDVFFIFRSTTTTQILFVRSTDQGATWSEPLGLSPVGQDLTYDKARPAVAPDGTLYVAWVDQLPWQILVVRSDDAGVSFTNPVAGGGAVQAFSPFLDITPDGTLLASTQLDITVDGNGTVYIVYSAASLTQPQPDLSDVYLVRSTDKGRTWSTPLRVNDDATATNQWMPSVAVAANGVVGVMFYDRRNDPANVDTDVYLAQSVDGGLSFLPNRRITDVSFPTSRPDLTDPNLPPAEFGDYNRMVAQGNDFYMVWADNRDTVGARPDPDVFFARQDACQLYRDGVAALDERIAFLEDALATGQILKRDEPAIRRLIQRLGQQRQGEEAALVRCRGIA